MKSEILRKSCALVLGLAVAGTAGMSVAQVSTNRVAAETDWSVFVDESPRQCWGVSAPKETVNTRDGSAVSVQRGDILLFVTIQPGKSGEVSFTGGYPFAGGSTVELNIGGNKFELFTEGEWAWAANADADSKIIAALRAGSSATLTALSSRGNQTQDTFSLLGISAAVDEAAKRCAG